MQCIKTQITEGANSPSLEWYDIFELIIELTIAIIQIRTQHYHVCLQLGTAKFVATLLKEPGF